MKYFLMSVVCMMACGASAGAKEKRAEVSTNARLAIDLKSANTYEEFLKIAQMTNVATATDVAEVIAFLGKNKISLNDTFVQPIVTDGSLKFGSLKLKATEAGEIIAANGTVLRSKKEQTFAETFKSHFMNIAGTQPRSAIIEALLPTAHAELASSAQEASAALAIAFRDKFYDGLSAVTCTVQGVVIGGSSLFVDALMYSRYLRQQWMLNGKVSCVGSEYRKLIPDFQSITKEMPGLLKELATDINKSLLEKGTPEKRADAVSKIVSCSIGTAVSTIAVPSAVYQEVFTPDSPFNEKRELKKSVVSNSQITGSVPSREELQKAFGGEFPPDCNVQNAQKLEAVIKAQAKKDEQSTDDFLTKLFAKNNSTSANKKNSSGADSGKR